MKISNKKLVQKPKSKKDDLVYCSYRDGELIIARRYVYPKLSAQNSSFAARNKNLFQLKPSDGYKADCRAYLIAYINTPQGQEKPILTWNNLYVKLMSALARKYPDINLNTLTREEIYAQQLPCISIARAVEAGLLPKVKGWNKLSREM
jgi:hypothetical protein